MSSMTYLPISFFLSFSLSLYLYLSFCARVCVNFHENKFLLAQVFDWVWMNSFYLAWALFPSPNLAGGGVKGLS
jgi:hypothetical protein